MDAAAFTADRVRAAEAPLLENGVPLMQRAAGVLARVAAEVLDGRRSAKDGSDGTDAAVSRVLVLAGGGDNGGDALFAAADLARRARTAVDVLRTGSSVGEDAWRAAQSAGARAVTMEDVDPSVYDLVLDGMVGIGARGKPSLRGAARDIVDLLLPLREGAGADAEVGREGFIVIAVDLPSGLHPDTGAAAAGGVLPADITVTFGAVKTGLVRAHGPRVAGEVLLADIGLEIDPADAAEHIEISRILSWDEEPGQG